MGLEVLGLLGGCVAALAGLGEAIRPTPRAGITSESKDLIKKSHTTTIDIDGSPDNREKKKEY